MYDELFLTVFLEKFAFRNDPYTHKNLNLIISSVSNRYPELSLNEIFFFKCGLHRGFIFINQNNLFVYCVLLLFSLMYMYRYIKKFLSHIEIMKCCIFLRCSLGYKISFNFFRALSNQGFRSQGGGDDQNFFCSL